MSGQSLELLLALVGGPLAAVIVYLLAGRPVVRSARRLLRIRLARRRGSQPDRRPEPEPRPERDRGAERDPRPKPDPGPEPRPEPPPDPDSDPLEADGDPPDVRRPREIRLGFALPDNPSETVTGPLRPGGIYLLWLEVGDRDPEIRESGSSWTEIDVAVFARLGGAFVPEGTGSFTLNSLGDVVVMDSRADRRRALPRGRLFFEVGMPPRETALSLRICLYRKAVLLRSYLLDARVGDGDGPAPSSSLDYSITASFDGRALKALHDNDISILVNHDGEGMHGLYVYGTHDGRQIRLSGRFEAAQLVTELDRARRRLTAATEGEGRYRYGPDAPSGRLAQDLLNLAVTGSRLWFDVIEGLTDGRNPFEERQALRESMREPCRVELATVFKADAVLHAAMFYDYPIDQDASGATVCPNGMRAVYHADAAATAQSACFLGRCPNYHDRSVVCPGGFWGFRHQVSSPQSYPLDDPTREPEVEVPSPGTAVIGVADDPGLTLHRPHIEWLEGRCAPARASGNAGRLAAEMASGTPGSLIYLYCHGGKTAFDGYPFLAFSSIDDNRNYLLPMSLDGPNWTTSPLVMMNGCRTAMLELGQGQSFVRVFLGRGASAVIGNEIVVYEQVACDFAVALLTELLDSVTLGEAMRSARLAILAQANPLGLAYTAIGHNGVHFSAGRVHEAARKATAPTVSG